MPHKESPNVCFSEHAYREKEHDLIGVNSNIDRPFAIWEDDSNFTNGWYADLYLELAVF